MFNEFKSFKYIPKESSKIEDFKSDTIFKGNPDGVIVAKNTNEVQDILKICYEKNIPVTFAASQTSMTGASTANKGILISINNINKVIDISKSGNPTITVEPGIFASDLQKIISKEGLYYPAVPTSKDESRIGGNVSTNAFGENSFKYGPVRRYVRKLKIIKSNGEELILERNQYKFGSSELGKAGYFVNWRDPIDLFIGSEGTLGFISEITLDLLPKEKPVFIMLVPFESNLNALTKLIKLAKIKPNDLRALEFIDEAATLNMKSAKDFPQTSLQNKAWLYLKIEYENLDLSINRWNDFINSSNAIIAKTPAEIDKFESWRHHIPEVNKTRKTEIEKTGGKKVSGDWWVPIGNLLEMMKFFYDETAKLASFHIAYAHLGQGHPHTSIFAKNKTEIKKARELQLICAKKAVSLGGGVAGEHGIGKLYKHLIPIQYDNETILKMHEWKNKFDPKGILGQGNIL